MSTIHVLLKRRAFEVFMSTMHGRLLAAMIGESRYSVFLCLLYLCASLSVLWLRCLRHGLRGGVSCAAFAARADGDGRPSFTSPLPFPASFCTLWLRCLRHGLRGGVTCAASAGRSDGDDGPSFGCLLVLTIV